MSSSSDNNTALLLNNLTIQFNRYFGIFIFIFGIIGNLLNILVLSQKTLRKNPCAWYFLMSSITSLISFFSGLTTRILSGWHLDYSDVNQGLCKVRGFVVFAFITATFWLITMAAIDRWLASSTLATHRRKSTLKNAQRGTIVIIILSIGLYTQMLFCYEANLVNTPTKCYSKSSGCRFVSDLSFALISILFPLLLMISFGLKTISNIRQSHLRIHTQITNPSGQQNLYRKTDRQLLLMLFSQVILLTILSIPLPIQRFYSTFTSNYSKTLLQQSISNFAYNLSVLFIYLANGISFYIYTISGGNTFRKALFNLVEIVRQKLLI
jgi:hypothetical protein